MIGITTAMPTIAMERTLLESLVVIHLLSPWKRNGPSAGMTLGYDSQLVVRDTSLNKAGNLDVDLLLQNQLCMGGIFNSNSWGTIPQKYMLR